MALIRERMSKSKKLRAFLVGSDVTIHFSADFLQIPEITLRYINPSTLSKIQHGGFVSIQKGAKLFRKKRILKLMAYLEDYLDFIGWDKVIEDENEGTYNTIYINDPNIVFVDKIIRSKRAMKDKWCGFVAGSLYYSENSTDEIIRFYHDAPFLDAVSSNRLGFESCNTYMTPLFPASLCRKFIGEYGLLDGLKARRDVQTAETKGYAKRLERAVEIVNNDNDVVIENIDLDNLNSLLFLRGKDFKSIIAAINYAKTTAKKDFYSEFDMKKFDSKIGELNVSQFTELFFSLHSAIKQCRNSVFARQGTNFEDILYSQYDRVKRGMKFDNLSIYQLKHVDFEMDYTYRVNYLLGTLATKEEYDRSKELNSSSFLEDLVFTDIFFFDKFCKNMNSFIYLDKDVSIVEAFTTANYSRTNFVSVVRDFEGGMEAFENYLKDPSVFFGLALQMEGVNLDSYAVDDSGYKYLVEKFDSASSKV